ncbi:hypothetical protein Ae168Ps1_6125 [Pseudonocardia sp. Ae168_Ps1]|uniref:hypothetical protein n=1 Tax=unclassified Pseudonocardia TaxID=2619320 RepID=UPI00094AE9D4|nr:MULTISPECIES: hypothetical protein [unclassified Pseudonocardia]OLL70256.1 hypothetical protein Ae150APs1_6059 [Pseudonocardia sp. Ae150A_Ps1]OLL70529.1 hypothetical protein Ae263Ps1_6279 [Pseudonocardia sp. Ae263_Ps1]OLL70660.1 hypothetical protein Ae168Ps1_6125 [Pseudonocardia sp. Ae168_Ps1]OLL89242.1 hypothetical protein Ae356Ps1_6161c [Pseudonocardia sp. Ae356_Ps1]
MLDPPIVAGVLGGVGTTLLAEALHGHDDGIYRAQRPVQVLVCRSTSNSLHSAQRALQYTPTAAPPPVLAIVDDVPNAAWGPNTQNKVHITEPYVTSLVRIPLVTDWRDVESPHSRASTVLAEDERDLPKGVRAFARALRELVGEVIKQNSGHRSRTA